MVSFNFVCPNLNWYLADALDLYVANIIEKPDPGPRGAQGGSGSQVGAVSAKANPVRARQVVSVAQFEPVLRVTTPDDASILPFNLWDG